MKVLFTVISLIISTFLISQNTDEVLLKKGIKQLEDGNTHESFIIFKKLHEQNKENESFISYLNYSNSKICSFKDSLETKAIDELLKSSQKSYLKDSTSIITQFSLANVLFLKAKFIKSEKEKAKLLTETKELLDKITNGNNANADTYNLLATWNRTSANYDSAITYHNKAFDLKEKSEYKYELALTYQTMGIEGSYINALNAGVDVHGQSSDDILFEKKCDDRLPKLGK